MSAQHTAMARSRPSGSSRCLALAVAICILLPCCFSSETEPTVFERACQCFDDHNVYRECAEELRVGVEGAFHVGTGSESVDAYCGGACLVETKMALQCVEAVADETFRFANGASLLAVKTALATGCSDTPQRGTFEVRESRDYCGGGYYDGGVHMQEQLGYGHGYGDQEQYQNQEQYQEQYQGGGFSSYCSGARAARSSSARMILLVTFFVASATSMLLAAI